MKHFARSSSNRQWRCQGVARRGLCPGCKPLCPCCAVPRQASRRHFILLCIAPVFCVSLYQQRPTSWCSWPQKAGFRKQINFQTFSGTPFAGGATLYPAPLPHSTAFARALDASTPLLDPEHRAPSEVMVPHLCSSKNKLLAPRRLKTRECKT